MALPHTILAALNTGAQSGYDLLKGFSSGNGCFWQATQQQIYRELGKLEELGLIVPEVVPQAGRPDKKLYSITPEGQHLLREWIAQPSKPTPIREELMVKVLAAHLVEPQVVLDELKRRQQQHQQQLETYQELWSCRGCANLSDLPIPFQATCMTLRRGIRYEQSWVDWCEEAILWLSGLPQ
jgi:DNA-binding PadR family transcriptional regulator